MQLQYSATTLETGLIKISYGYIYVPFMTIYMRKLVKLKRIDFMRQEANEHYVIITEMLKIC